MKLLQVRGWTVISIPFFNWSNQSEEYRVAYLQQVRFRVQGLGLGGPPSAATSTRQ